MCPGWMTHPEPVMSQTLEESSPGHQAKNHQQTSMVIGANRGIGLALIEALLGADNDSKVIAVHRPSAELGSLQLLVGNYGDRLQLRSLDFTHDESLQAFGEYLREQKGGIGLTIHAAGMLHAGDIQPEKTIKQCRASHLQRLFEVNSIFPLLVAQALLSAQSPKHPFTFAALSAMVGSIGDNRLGGWYGYRASKSALNQFIKTLSIECRSKFPHASIVAIHPGTTDTGLSNPFQRNVPPGKLYTTQQTASRILAVVRALDEKQTGQFLNWDGNQIPW
jgi:NAD(P)-dependent dehydrogenase (short-subunit alcohol dehydrogenase family)